MTSKYQEDKVAKGEGDKQEQMDTIRRLQGGQRRKTGEHMTGTGNEHIHFYNIKQEVTTQKKQQHRTMTQLFCFE